MGNNKTQNLINVNEFFYNLRYVDDEYFIK